MGVVSVSVGHGLATALVSVPAVVLVLLVSGESEKSSDGVVEREVGPVGAPLEQAPSTAVAASVAIRAKLFIGRILIR